MVYLEREGWEIAYSKSSGFHLAVIDALTREHAGKLSTIGSLKFAGLESAFACENAQEYVNFEVL